MHQRAPRSSQSQGLGVVKTGPAGLPSDQQAIQPSQLYEWVRTHTPRSAEAVFIGGNGLPAIGIIKALEEDLSRPVLTANQVAFWHALRLSDTRSPLLGYAPISACGLPSPKCAHRLPS